MSDATIQLVTRQVCMIANAMLKNGSHSPMAYAAGTGSLVVVARSWRLLSFGRIVGLLLRSTDVQGFVSDSLVPELGETDGPRDDFLDRSPK